MEIHDWLNKTTAADLMVREVETLRANATLAQAADLLLGQQISGAPVVDAAGHCVGVLSATDVAGAEGKVVEEMQKVAKSTFFSSDLALPMRVYSEQLSQVRDKIAPAAEQPVEHFMTSDLVSVDVECPLRDVVQYMVDAHIHRVVVLDADRRLAGIISTTDVLAALLRTSD